MPKREVLVLLMLAWATTDGQAAGIRDLADGWLFGPAATVRLIAGSTPQTESVWLALGHSQLYGVAALPVADLLVGVRGPSRWGAPALQLRWQSLGQGLYHEDERLAQLRWGRRLAIGAQLRSLVVRTGGEGGIPERRESFWQVIATLQTDWDIGASTAVRLEMDLAIAERAALRLRDARRRLLAVEGWHGVTGFAAALDVQPNQTPTIGVEWLVARGGAAAGIRLEPSVGVVGFVFAWHQGRLLLRTSHLAHPQLGLTHRVQLGFGLGGGSSW